MRGMKKVLVCGVLGALLTVGCGGSSQTSSNPGSIAGCQVFPAWTPALAGGNAEWNRDISGDAVDPNSAAYIAAMNGATRKLHPDFGSDPTYGIPWVSVPGSQPTVPMAFQYASESDPGPYPFPPDAPIEGGASSTGDRHVLVIDHDNCKLYETYDSHLQGSGWQCGSGAVFDFKSNTLRPDGWTSADAAGLPIFPGLVRLDEVQAGEIRHALRVTFSTTQMAYVHPATHQASSNTNASEPPMGLRLRLKASYDLSGFTGAPKVILTAMQKYGLIVADNGSDWYFTGETNTMWNDNELDPLKTVPGSAFEVVTVGKLMQ